MIASVQLQNFRSYKDNSFEFEPGVNIIVGANASGKTNLLEAILILARGKSYRARDAELVRTKQTWARIDSTDEHGKKRVVKVKNIDDKTEKIFDLNGDSKKRLNFELSVPVVLFEPNQLQQLTTSPSQRRQFVDELLEQTDPSFGPLRRQYERILTQRNSLLKQKKLVGDQMFVWNLRLSEVGAAIADKRQALLKKLNKTLTKNYQQIAGTKDKLKLVYESDCQLDQYGSSLLKKLAANQDLDLLRGFTGFGPHRDDIAILINNQPLGKVASRGEARTVLLSLKIQELSMVEDARQIKPLLLFDDVFSELDGVRRKALTYFLKDYQTFITTTDADIVTHEFAQAGKLIML